MAEYLAPGVYLQREVGVQPINSVGTSTAGFVGITARGPIGKPVFVSSWTDFETKFAKGLYSPFLKNSDLAYAVYGYFQNGGGKAYIVRCASESATKATTKVPNTAEGVTFTAIDEGVWANENLKVAIESTSGSYSLQVMLNGVVVEEYSELSATISSPNYFMEVINSRSNYLRVSPGDIASGIGIFTGGADGDSDIVDADFLGKKGLGAFDVVSDVNLIAIPGETSNGITQGLVDYCSKRKDCFAVPDLPMGMTSVLEINEAKTKLVGAYGATYYPWGKVVDPLVKGKLRLVPPSGHMMGVYARTDKERGVHKAPAGVEAQVKGFVELDNQFSKGEIEVLNPNGVNTIIAKPNFGIISWGARLLSPNGDRTYVSDMRLDINIEQSIEASTQWTVFEPNDEELWGKIVSQVKDFLYTKWVQGALKGTSPEEAYFVKCDAELNTEEIINSGQVLCKVGYAKKKPAEFTIFTFSQKTSN